MTTISDSGRWAAIEEREYNKIKPIIETPQGSVGEFLYQVGLCSCNDSYRNFNRKSSSAKKLYFFEFAITTGCNLACNVSLCGR